MFLINHGLYKARPVGAVASASTFNQACIECKDPFTRCSYLAQISITPFLGTKNTVRMVHNKVRHYYSELRLS